MKLPNFQRLISNDFSEEQKAIVDQLASSLNIGIDTLYQALNKKVSLADNVDCLVKDVTVIVDSSGIPTADTLFKLDDTTRNIIGIQVIKATNLTNSSTYPSGAIFLSYAQQQNGVQILHATGLQASNKYTLKIVAYY